MAFRRRCPRFAHFFESVLGTLGIFPVGEQFESATCKTWEVELASTMKLNGSLVVNPVPCANGFQYTMHPSCVGCNAGSMWSSGITPWSMEIQGAFSKDDEIRKQSLIDYCSPTSNGDTRININEIRDGLVG
ncbi:hypothetical protein JL720_12472 [Aureococcus anophagefferens]|nr:hypothetical protein JL720_12472 [Aureococcus anophagefferens]